MADGRVAAKVAASAVGTHNRYVDGFQRALVAAAAVPHIGSGTLDTRRAMVSLAVDNLVAALGFGPHAGRPPNAVTRR